MPDSLVSTLVRELAALTDEELRPLAQRLTAFMPTGEPAAAFLSVGQAAERLGVHPNTVYRMIVAGRLGAVRAGRLWRIPEAELARVSPGPATIAPRPALTPPRSSRRFGDLVRELPYAGSG